MKKVNYKICYNQRWPLFRNLKLLRFRKRKWLFLKKIIERDGLGFNNQSGLDFMPLFNKYNSNFPTIIRCRMLYKNSILLNKRMRFNDIFLKGYQLKRLARKKQKYSNQAEDFLFNLNSRLDIIVYRTRLFSSIVSLNQFIRHEGLLLNNKVVFNGNIQVKEGDIIQFRPEKLKFYKIFFNKFYNYRLSNYNNVVDFNFDLLLIFVKNLDKYNLIKTLYAGSLKDIFWSTRVL